MTNRAIGISIDAAGMAPLTFRRKIANDRIGRMETSHDEYEASDLDCLKCTVVGGCCMSSPDCIVRRKSLARRAGIRYESDGGDGSYSAKYKNAAIKITKHSGRHWSGEVSNNSKTVDTGDLPTFKAVKAECRKIIIGEFA